MRDAAGFLLKTAVSIAMRVVMVLIQILASIKHALFASKASEAEVRKARSAAIAD